MDQNEIDRLRINSQAKHEILKDYLPAWFSIMGTWNSTLNYFDCFAGPGRYLWNEQEVEGSPIISINACRDLLTSNRRQKPKKINLIFIDEDQNQLTKLRKQIETLKDRPEGLNIMLAQWNSESFITSLLSKKDSLEPSFFFIDPYGHPFSIELMRNIMGRSKTEIMVNLMWYRIRMDLNNQQKTELCDKLFSPEKCRDVANKISIGTKFSSDRLIEYLHGRLGAKYHIPFRVMYGPDEEVTSNRLKYVLLHYSNNLTAFKLMLSTMLKNSDDGNPLTVQSGRSFLFPFKNVKDLEERIKNHYVNTGLKITFEDFQDQNWRWYFIEKNYRDVLKKLEKDGIIDIKRITSKRDGLKEHDLLIFKRLS